MTPQTFGCTPTIYADFLWELLPYVVFILGGSTSNQFGYSSCTLLKHESTWRVVGVCKQRKYQLTPSQWCSSDLLGIKGWLFHLKIWGFIWLPLIQCIAAFCLDITSGLSSLSLIPTMLLPTCINCKHLCDSTVTSSSYVWYPLVLHKLKLDGVQPGTLLSDRLSDWKDYSTLVLSVFLADDILYCLNLGTHSDMDFGNVICE